MHWVKAKGSGVQVWGEWVGEAMGGSKALLLHFSFGQGGLYNSKADFHLTLIQDSTLFFYGLAAVTEAAKF